MSLLLGHTPPPLALAALGVDSPFYRYAGIPADRELAIALDKFRESSDPDAESDDQGPDALSGTATTLMTARARATEAMLGEESLRHWQSDVRRMLVVNELLALFAVVPAVPTASGKYRVVLRLPAGVVDIMTVRTPSLGHLCSQLGRVIAAAKDREERRQEILSQVAAVDVFFASVLGLHPEQHAMTIELMDVVSRVVAATVQLLKHLCDAPRPAELSPKVQPIILAPGHASFPGGHAAYSFALALVLAVLSNRGDATVRRLGSLAGRISRNRVVAGLHYPTDNRAGSELGVLMGVHMAVLATSGADLQALRRADVAEDEVSFEKLGDDQADALAQACNGNIAPKFSWMWEQADREWRRRACADPGCADPVAAPTSAAP